MDLVVYLLGLHNLCWRTVASLKAYDIEGIAFEGVTTLREFTNLAYILANLAATMLMHLLFFFPQYGTSNSMCAIFCESLVFGFTLLQNGAAREARSNGHDSTPPSDEPFLALPTCLAASSSQASDLSSFGWRSFWRKAALYTSTANDHCGPW